MRRRSKKGLANGSTLDKLTLIQVDFEKDLLPRDLNKPEIVLAEGIVVLIKIIVSRDRDQDGLV
jgi:hypothetical protein